MAAPRNLAVGAAHPSTCSNQGFAAEDRKTGDRATHERKEGRVVEMGKTACALLAGVLLVLGSAVPGYAWGHAGFGFHRPGFRCHHPGFFHGRSHVFIQMSLSG